jgi:nucleoside-diphosphate-sugar epimerase
VIAFVTGGTGFVGSHLVEALLAGGHTVRCLVRDTAKAGRVFGDRVVRIGLIPGDLDDTATLVRACTGSEVVFHVAGLTAAANPGEFHRINAAAAGRVADAAQRAGAGRVVLVSSQAAAGPSTRERASVESDPPHPVTEYGRSKLAGEQAVKASGSTWTIVRPPTVYGPRDTEMLRVFKLARFKVMPVFGDGSQRLSLIYVADLAQALIAAAQPACARKTYFACHPEVVTARELVMAVYRAVRPRGSGPVVISLPKTVTRAALMVTGATAALLGRATVLSPDKANEFLADAFTCSPAALKRDAKWTAAHDLKSGAADTAAWYRAAGWL